MLPALDEPSTAEDWRNALRDAGERRREARSRSFLPGLVYFQGDASAHPVTIYNRSRQGAKLKFTTAIPLPSSFRLFDERENMTHQCRVLWKALPFVGVSFV